MANLRSTDGATVAAEMPHMLTIRMVIGFAGSLIDELGIASSRGAEETQLAAWVATSGLVLFPA